MLFWFDAWGTSILFVHYACHKIYWLGMQWNNDARLILRRPYQESLTGQRHNRKPRIPTRTVDSCFDLVSDCLVANMGPKGLFNRGGGSAGMSVPKRNFLQNRSIFGAFSTIFSRYAYVLIGLNYNACRVIVRHGCAHLCPQSSFIHVGCDTVKL